MNELPDRFSTSERLRNSQIESITSQDKQEALRKQFHNAEFVVATFRRHPNLTPGSGVHLLNDWFDLEIECQQPLTLVRVVDLLAVSGMDRRLITNTINMLNTHNPGIGQKSKYRALADVLNKTVVAIDTTLPSAKFNYPPNQPNLD